MSGDEVFGSYRKDGDESSDSGDGQNHRVSDSQVVPPLEQPNRLIKESACHGLPPLSNVWTVGKDRS